MRQVKRESPGNFGTPGNVEYINFTGRCNFRNVAEYTVTHMAEMDAEFTSGFASMRIKISLVARYLDLHNQ